MQMMVLYRWRRAESVFGIDPSPHVAGGELRWLEIPSVWQAMPDLAGTVMMWLKRFQRG